MDSIGTLLDRFQGFFSRSFFIGSFLPVVIFLLLNGVLTHVTFPTGGAFLLSILDLSFSDKVIFGFILLLLLFALGLLVSSMNPWFRQYLAGDYLPEYVRKFLISRQSNRYNKLNDIIESLHEKFVQYQEVINEVPSWEQELREARQKGERTQAQPHGSDSVLLALKTPYAKLAKMKQRWDEIPFASMQSFFTQLKGALETRPASHIPELDKFHTEFLDLLEYASARTEMMHTKVWVNLSLRFPQETSYLGPTRLANLTEVHREYGLSRYGLDMEKHWLKVSKFINQDTNFHPILDDAKMQLDFSVAIISLTFITTAIWLPLTVIFAPNFYPYLAVAGIGPLLFGIFYLIVIQNYRTFTEAVQSAIDLYHFNVIKALHFPLPKTPKEEKEFWKQLELYADTLTYEHEESAIDETPKPKSFWQLLASWF